MEGIDIFVKVVDAKSFTRAAARLGMPTTTVSARIARLEERLGVTLIQRTTRHLRVTPAGEAYYDHCVRALAEISEGEREIVAGNESPSGLLRITAPADLTHSVLPPLVDAFLERYSGVSVELVVTNRRVDLITEGIDLAIRVGPLQDSTLVIRKFLSGRAGLWASSAYLKRKGTPRKSSDLKDHEFVRFALLSRRVKLRSVRGDVLELNAPSRISTDDLNTVKLFAQYGFGICLLPDLIGGDPSLRPALVKVFPGYTSDVFAVNFVYPAQRFVPLTVRAFIALACGENKKKAVRKDRKLKTAIAEWPKSALPIK